MNIAVDWAAFQVHYGSRGSKSLSRDRSFCLLYSPQPCGTCRLDIHSADCITTGP